MCIIGVSKPEHLTNFGHPAFHKVEFGMVFGFCEPFNSQNSQNRHTTKPFLRLVYVATSDGTIFGTILNSIVLTHPHWVAMCSTVQCAGLRIHVQLLGSPCGISTAVAAQELGLVKKSLHCVLFLRTNKSLCDLTVLPQFFCEHCHGVLLLWHSLDLIFSGRTT